MDVVGENSEKCHSVIDHIFTLLVLTFQGRDAANPGGVRMQSKRSGLSA